MDLLKGCEYEFRVSAENEVGVGDPSPPSKPVFAKDPIGMPHWVFPARIYFSLSFSHTHSSTVKPGPPLNLKVIDFSKESVTLSWDPPADTGRGKIFGYLLEFQKAGEEEWSKVGSMHVPFKHLRVSDDLMTFKCFCYLCSGEPHSRLMPGDQV